MSAGVIVNLSRNDAGFSLVELAMSLLIVGLMLGGILKGQELIGRARLQKTLSQIMSYQAAYVSFREKFQAIPGDYGAASRCWGEFARDGNQNGVVEGHGRAAGTEATAFWQHLAMAGLIPLAVTSPESLGVCAYGQGLPRCALGGGFTVEESPDDLSGLWLIVGKESGDRGTGALFTPDQAAFLNRQLDNGHPLTGHVRSREGDGIPLGQCVAEGAYSLGVTRKTCILYVHLD